MMIRDDYLWSQKYRPKTIDECVLPESLKDTFRQFVKDKNIPNLLLHGRAGVGKTTVAYAMLNEIGADYITINGSLDGNIDTLRNRIQQFASTVSFSEGRKYVLIDEGDYLTAATQPALRNFIDEYSKNCGFILTCNYRNRIIEPLDSRFSAIEFKINPADKPAHAMSFFKRVCAILDENNITYDKAVIAELITKCFPDWRKVLNELQTYSANGKIDTGILADLTGDSFKRLIKMMKERSYSDVRKWVAENVDMDSSMVFRKFYDTASELVSPQAIPQLVLILADYQYKAAFVADKEINMSACMAEIMVNVQFKD